MLITENYKMIEKSKLNRKTTTANISKVPSQFLSFPMYILGGFYIAEFILYVQFYIIYFFTAIII